jgi:DNA-directed RNA polymerase specialized sigma24 family protein
LSAESKHEFLTAVEQAHGRQLRRFFSARMRNAADVPDLVQEVFLRLLRVEHHEAIPNPQAYLYTVASHVLHQHALRETATTEAVRFADILRDLRLSDEPDPALEATRRLPSFRSPRAAVPRRASGLRPQRASPRRSVMPGRRRGTPILPVRFAWLRWMRRRLGALLP